MIKKIEMSYRHIIHILYSQPQSVSLSQMSLSSGEIATSSAINRKLKRKIPDVSGGHFRRRVQAIRGKHITTRAALLDLIDNIFGMTRSLKLTKIKCDITLEYCAEGKLCRIKISDNIPSGFKDLLKEGIENPFSMENMREGHSNDEETSEFGVGLNEALVFLSYLTEIFTHYRTDDGEEGFAKIGFDIDKMSSVESPEESFQPSEYNLDISRDEFMQNHVNSGNLSNGSDHGSTIDLRLRKNQSHMCDSETKCELDRTQFEEYLITYLRDTYSDILKCDSNEVTIKVNGVVVTSNVEFLHMISAENKSSYTFHSKLNSRGECIAVYRQRKTPGRSPYTEYVEKDKKHRAITADEFYSNVSAPNVYMATLEPFTTKGSEYEHIQHQNKVAVSRDGRFYERIPYTKSQADGYANHIGYNFKFVSKKLSPIVGVGSNKRVVPPPNLLTSAIRSTVEEMTTKYRKYAKDYKKNTASSSVSSTTSAAAGGGGGGAAPVIVLNDNLAIVSHEVAVPAAVVLENSDIAVNDEQLFVPISQDEPVLLDSTSPSLSSLSLSPLLPSGIEDQSVCAPLVVPVEILDEQQQPLFLFGGSEVPVSTRNVSSSVQERITCDTGLRLLLDWKMSGQSHDVLNEYLDETLIAYTKADDWGRNKFYKYCLSDRTLYKKYEWLVELILSRYPISTEEMYKGSELKRKYSAVFGSSSASTD